MEQKVVWWNKIVKQCERELHHKRCISCGSRGVCEKYINNQIDNEFIKFYLPNKFSYDNLPKDHKELVNMIFTKIGGKECLIPQLV